MKREQIVVDGANVSYVRQTKEDKPMISNIILVRKKLRHMGYEPIVVVDASIRHKVKDMEQFQGLINKGKVIQAPADTDADYFILKIAQEKDTKMVTNDTYKEYNEEFKDIKDRRVPFTIIDSDVIFYKLEDRKK